MAGALTAIRALKLRIPDQVGLVGFDLTTWSSLVEPTLTLIEQPTYDIGRTATELLLERIENPGRPSREVILEGRMVIGGSSAPRSG